MSAGLMDLRFVAKGSKYKYVVKYVSVDKKTIRWGTNLPTFKKSTFLNERDAAIAVDKYLISNNKEPINILVRREKI